MHFLNKQVLQYIGFYLEVFLLLYKMIKVFSANLVGCNLLERFYGEQRGFSPDERSVGKTETLWEQDIYGSFLIGRRIIIEETYNPFAQIVQRVLDLTYTSDELSFGEVYFCKILT